MNIIGIDIGTTLVKIIETNENLEILNKMTIDKTYTNKYPNNVIPLSQGRAHSLTISKQEP